MVDHGWWKRLGALGGRTLGMLAVIVILIAAADRTGWLVDASADRRYTVHPRLAELVAKQIEPVELVGIWTLEHAEALAPVEALARQLGGAPGVTAGKVTYRHIDPELHQPLVAAFAKDHGECLPDMLYVVRGKRMVRIALAPGIRLTLQRELGGALVTLADTNPPKALLLAGHGELRSRGGAADGDDLLAHTLELAGYAVDRRDSASAAPIPPDAVLVVGGPMSPLGRELDALSAHLTDGGGALILADDRTPADLNAWLRRRGFFLGDPPAELNPAAPVSATPPGIVVSLRRHVVGQEAAFPHPNLAIDGPLINPDHPVSGPVANGGVALLSPFTTAVWVLDPAMVGAQAQALAGAFTALGTPPFQGATLLRTAPADAWLKSRAAPFAVPENLENRGFLPLAGAIEYAPATESVRAGVGGRLLVWGSRQAASDGVLGRGVFANEELLRRGVDWLARRTAPTSIPPAELTAFRVDATDQTLWFLFAALVLILPCIFLGGAMLTWWDRR